MKNFSCIWSMLLVLAPLWCVGQSQDRLATLGSTLDSLSQSLPQLKQEVQLSLEDVSLADYLRALGQAHRLNVYVEETPGVVLSTDFEGESVRNVLLFLCKEFQYSFDLTGSILSFFPYQAPESSPPLRKAPDLTFHEGELRADLQSDSLSAVIRQISQLTGVKILTRPGTDALLTVFLPATPLDTALEAIFTANDLQLRRRPKGYYLVESLIPSLPTAQMDQPIGRTDFEMEVLNDGDQILISVQAEQADLAALIQALFQETKLDYLQYVPLQGVVSLEAELLPFDELLSHLFQANEYTYKRDGQLYLIGQQNEPGLATTRIVHLHYRPTYQAIDLIPGIETIDESSREDRQMQTNPEYQNSPQNNWNQGFGNTFAPPETGPSEVAPPPSIVKTKLEEVEIVEYPELNRIILKGPAAEVDEIAWFLAQIDQPVPMVKVEMLVVEVNQDRLLSTSVSAGRKQNRDTLSLLETLLPNLNVNAGGDQINQVLEQIPALSNLGILNSEFYVRIRAQEERGNLKVEMQPVLSMLNGRSASLTVGQTQYYLLETQTAANGAVNNFTQFT
ncbi:MAG: hypothetical protein AAGM67_05995, partial [Bacteroidota bacterium]